MFVDSEEIQALFDEVQECHAVSIQRESANHIGGYILNARDWRGRRLTKEQKARRSAVKRERTEADIRARLLAGERPVSAGGPRRGAKATIWAHVAKQLGIEITFRTVTPEERLESKRQAARRSAYRAQAPRIKARILAGERPRQMGSLWHRAAAELGVDLGAPVGAPCST